jgi:hypothetical protein
MARNLLADHRVSVERFAEFSGIAGDLLSITDIREALEDYQARRVRPLRKTGTPPAYALPNNANNAVLAKPAAQLGTVLDLTRLGRVYAEARSTFKMPEFSTYEVTDPRNQTQVNEFLESRLKDFAQQEKFLRATFKAIARYRKQFEARALPTWAAEWNTLKDCLNPVAPQGWLQAVGVPRDNAVWLAVIRYAVSNRTRAVRLFRPTQLDAGWYAHHFPSPPQAELAKGGHTMFLSRDGAAEMVPPPVSEFLHEQIDFGIREWLAGGRLVGFTGAPIKGTLDRQRHQHLALLQTVYGEGVGEWMPSPL